MDVGNFFFKYFVYFPVLVIRREWIGSHLKSLERSQFYSEEALEKIQLERLNRLLKHAKDTVPHYGHLANVQLQSLDELETIPLLEKEAVRYNADQLYSSASGSMTRFKTTGGSTGAPVTLRKDSRGMAHELAATWRGYRWAGVGIGDRQARFWGVPSKASDRRRAALIDLIAHRKRLSAFSFSDVELENYVVELSKFRPDYFYGYVSMIRQFADYVERNNRMGLIKPKAIITTAEALSDPDRCRIEQVFGCKVFNEYGCGELGTIAHECEFGNLHISAENMIVEVLTEEGSPAARGEPGEVVVTDLVNFSMPLIRYRLRDTAILSSETCGCGRNLPIISAVLGRQYDMLINSKGQKFHGEFFLYIFEDLKKLGRAVDLFQIIQDNDRNLKINIKCVDDIYEAVIKVLDERLRKDFDEKLKYQFMKVDGIERESSGKFRIIKREN